MAWARDGMALRLRHHLRVPCRPVFGTVQGPTLRPHPLQQRRRASGGRRSSPPSTSGIALVGADSKYSDMSFGPTLFRALQLATFSHEELRAAFDLADTDGEGHLDRDKVRMVLLRVKQGRACDRQLEDRVERMVSGIMARFDDDRTGRISFEQFETHMVEIADERDPRLWPVACTMLVTGTAVGCILPCMPILVNQLGLSQAAFGTVVAAFGLAKLLANIPCAYLADKYGRRLLMVGGLGVICTSFIGIGECPLLALERAGACHVGQLCARQRGCHAHTPGPRVCGRCRLPPLAAANSRPAGWRCAQACAAASRSSSSRVSSPGLACPR